MQFIKGMRDKIQKYLDKSKPFSVEMDISGNSEYDCCCFGVDEAGKLSNEDYMFFYNQICSPNNSVKLSKAGTKTIFDIDLTKIPSDVVKLVFTVSIDGNGTMAEMNN